MQLYLYGQPCIQEEGKLTCISRWLYAILCGSSSGHKEGEVEGCMVRAAGSLESCCQNVESSASNRKKVCRRASKTGLRRCLCVLSRDRGFWDCCATKA